MNSPQIPFEIQLDPEELNYTSYSLEDTISRIREELDIVDLAEKLGIKLRKIDTDEFSDYTDGMKNIHAGNCPRCGESESLLISWSAQSFGCMHCNWSGLDYFSDLKLLEFLSHCSPNEFRSEDSYYEETNKKILKLYSLFPDRLGFLAGKDPHKYSYSDYYLEVAKRYYPGINEDISRLENRLITSETSVVMRQAPKTPDFYTELHNLRKKLEELKRISRAHEVRAMIYARAGKTQQLLSASVTRDEIGLSLDPWIEAIDHEEVMPNTWSHQEKPEIPLNTIGIYSRTLGENGEDTSYFIEIPDATFDSTVSLNQISSTLPGIRRPILGEYVIAYSRKHNNFSLFFAPGKEAELGQSYIPRFGMQTLIIQQHIGHIVHAAMNDIKDKNMSLPEDYRGVAYGGYVYSPIGLYLSFSPKETDFDMSLFEASMNGLSLLEGTKIFRKSEDFIKAYHDKEKELGVEPPLRTGYHNDRGYEYEVV